MKSISFVKYTSYGNNFVIVDETRNPVLSEGEKSHFAYQATNIHFGVGSDNFLVIQPCRTPILEEINTERRYWEAVPDAASADFIFRMFEPDGQEALSCGNGLMCIADFLHRKYGMESIRIMTEIPSGRPKVISIGTDVESGKNWANMGHPRRMPPELVVPGAIKPHDDTIGIMEDIGIHFRAHDLAPFSRKRSLKISGYLVFTGEPHMVLFPEYGISIKELKKMLFIGPHPESKNGGGAEKRVSFGSWLIHHIGTYVNKRYGDLFPAGLNINFVRKAPGTQALEYRCFERGIYRETLACGTGALAASFVSRRLNLLGPDPITIWPHRCRWEIPDAHIIVREQPGGWYLYGNPNLLFSGDFARLSKPIERETAAAQPLAAVYS